VPVKFLAINCTRVGSTRGRTCRVVQVVNALVTFQWLGDYARLAPQVVPVNRFIVDFKLVGVEA
jgi:hypothetical protein